MTQIPRAGWLYVVIAYYDHQTGDSHKVVAHSDDYDTARNEALTLQLGGRYSILYIEDYMTGECYEILRGV